MAPVFPIAGHGRPWLRHIPDAKSVAAHTVLGDATWRTISWRRGTKGRLAARFAALRIRVADGPTQRIRDMGNQHMPGEEVWLIGEHRSNEERKYYLSNLPADAAFKVLAASEGALDLRAGEPADEGRTRSRPLQRAILDRPASTRTDDDGRLRVPAILPPRRGRWGEKGSPVLHRNRPCQPSGKPFSPSLHRHRRYDVPIVVSVLLIVFCQMAIPEGMTDDQWQAICEGYQMMETILSTKSAAIDIDKVEA